MVSRIVTGVFVVLAIILCFASLGHAQIYGGGQQAPTQPTYSVPDHPQHADYGTMRSEQSLLSSSITTAHGERPMSDFPDDSRAVSLGEVARKYREEHAKAEKATIVWNQQGQ